MNRKIADRFNLELSEEDRKRISREEIKALEELFRQLKNGEIEASDWADEERFSAEWMHPVGEPVPDWRNKKKPSTLSDKDEADNGRQDDPKKPKP